MTPLKLLFDKALKSPGVSLVAPVADVVEAIAKLDEFTLSIVDDWGDHPLNTTLNGNEYIFPNGSAIRLLEGTPEPEPEPLLKADIDELSHFPKWRSANPMDPTYLAETFKRSHAEMQRAEAECRNQDAQLYLERCRRIEAEMRLEQVHQYQMDVMNRTVAPPFLLWKDRIPTY